MRKCSNCGIEKELSEFYKNKYEKDGYGYYCKICSKDKAKKHYSENLKNNKDFQIKNLEKARGWYYENKEKLDEERKNNSFDVFNNIDPKCVICGEKISFERFRKKQENSKYCSNSCYKKEMGNNRKKNLEWKKDHNKKKREKYVSKKTSRINTCKRCGKKFNATSLTKIYCGDRCRINSHRENKYNNNSYYKIEILMRTGFNQKLKNCLLVKNKSFFKYSGKCISEYISYFESRFPNEFIEITDKNKYHIDHIIPCCLYDFEDEEEIKKCWQPENLRIIPAEENLSKSGKLDMDLVIEHNIQHLLPKKIQRRSA